jgi:hypothetical protein
VSFGLTFCPREARVCAINQLKGSKVTKERSAGDEEDRLSPQEMQKWLQQELADLAKAVELRTKEATEFVTAYRSGKISAQEAAERLWKYDRRWGESLSGTHTAKGATDEELLAEIDEARHPQFVERLLTKGRQAIQKKS